MQALKVFLLLQVCYTKESYASNKFDLDAFFADKESEWSRLNVNRRFFKKEELSSFFNLRQIEKTDGADHFTTKLWQLDCT